MEGREQVETARNGDQPVAALGLEDVLSNLHVLIEAKQAEVDAAMAVVQDLQVDLRRMRAMERAAVGPQQRVSLNRAKHGLRYGEEEIRIVVEQLRHLDEPAFPDIPGSFTTRTLREKLGMDKSKAERVLEALRIRELVRLVGERKEPRASRPSRVFALIEDEDVQS